MPENVPTPITYNLSVNASSLNLRYKLLFQNMENMTLGFLVKYHNQPFLYCHSHSLQDTASEIIKRGVYACLSTGFI